MPRIVTADSLGPEPWSEPVSDIAVVLATASATLAQHVVAPQVVRDADVLWAQPAEPRECGRKIRRWTQDQTELPEAEISDGIPPRRQDNLRPLLRIAALAGGHWPQRAKAAALAIDGEQSQ